MVSLLLAYHGQHSLRALPLDPVHGGLDRLAPHWQVPSE